MTPALKRFCSFCEDDLSIKVASEQSDLSGITEVFSDDIDFADPMHQCSGIEAVTDYYRNVMAPAEFFNMSIDHLIEDAGEAYARWTITMRSPIHKNGEEFSFSGVTHLKFNNKICFYRDYLDTGVFG